MYTGLLQNICIWRLHFPYPSSEQFQPRQSCGAVEPRAKHSLREHQEEPSHREEEDVEEKKSSEENKIWEDACAKAPAHCLQRRVPQLQGWEEWQAAVPGLSCNLETQITNDSKFQILKNLNFWSRYYKGCHLSLRRYHHFPTVTGTIYKLHESIWCHFKKQNCVLTAPVY